MIRLNCKSSLVLIASLFSTTSYGSGFAIQEQSVTGLGRAFAGSAAVADDASTLFFNPAGMTNLSSSELAVGLHIIAPESDFDNEGSVTGSNTPLIGDSSNDAGKLTAVPNLFYVHKFDDRLFAGVGITVPFGLVTEYNDGWVGRYHAIRSGLKTININPNIAFKATEKLSIAAGISAQYADIELSNAIDFGTICAGVNPALPCSTPQTNDGQVKIKADDWAFGYNLGLTYQMTDATRLGLTYRSKISHTLKGDGDFRVPSNIPSLISASFADGNVQGDLDVPESASLAIHHRVNEKLAVMADATWTRWSRFEQLIIESDEVARLNTEKPEHWENTMRYGLGFDYQYDPKLTLRAGVAYDESPIPNEFRTARIAGEDRTWLAFGASYKVSDQLTLDAGYTHIFIDDPDIDETNEAATAERLIGQYEASVDIVSVQARWALD